MVVCIELRIHTPGGSQPILLGQPNVVKEGPQHIIAVAIIVLVHSIIIQKYRNTTLKIQCPEIESDAVTTMKQQNLPSTTGDYYSTQQTQSSKVSTKV
jgi:hypothetical protein